MRRLVIALLSFALLAPAAGAQTAAEVVARYGRVVDPEGRAARLEGVTSKGSFAMPAQGIQATVVSMQARPHRMSTIVTVPDLGEMRQGFDGTTAWATDPLQGPRIMMPAEAAGVRDASDFRTITRDAALFTALELVGEAEVDGERCQRVRHTWASGRVTTDCYSVASGLMIESQDVQESPQGRIAVTVRLSDYRPVAGVLMPHRMVSQMMGATQVVTLTEVTAGPIDAALFDLPPAIKALRDR